MVEFNTTDQQDVTDRAVLWGQVALNTLSPTSVGARLFRSSYCPAGKELCKAFGKMTIFQLQVIIPVPIEVPTEARSCAVIYLRYS